MNTVTSRDYTKKTPRIKRAFHPAFQFIIQLLTIEPKRSVDRVSCPTSHIQSPKVEDANEEFITMESEPDLGPLIEWILGQIVFAGDDGESA